MFFASLEYTKMENLKQCIKEYRQIDDEIREMNKKVAEKREDRKDVESKLSAIMALPQFSGYDRFKIEDDGSSIRIQRPNAWTKAWTLSQKELSELLEQYFQTDRSPTAEGCTKFIIEQKKRTLVSTDFNFVRTLPAE